MSIKFFHRYLGLALCLVLLSTSLTGIVLVWKKEFLWLTVEGARENVDTNFLATAIDNIEDSYMKNEVIFIQLYSEDLSIHKVFLTGQHYAWHNQRGEKIHTWSGNERLEDFVLDLHRRFLMGNKIGLNIVGFAGLLTIPLAIIGLMIWWPRKRSLASGLFFRSFKRGVLIRNHGNIGGVFVLPILLMTITGVILEYPVESRKVLLESVSGKTEAVTENTSFDVNGGMPSWENIIEIARQRFPESQIRSVQPSSDGAAKKMIKRSISLQQKEGLHRLGRTSLKFFLSGELIIKDELKQPIAKRVFGFSYPLHTAKLGWFYRLIVTLVGLAFSLLCILGLVSYLKVQSRRSND